MGFNDQSDNTLKRVSILGGPTVTICRLANGAQMRGASWGPDNTIIFGTDAFGADGAGGLWRVSASGGEPEQLTTPDPEQGGVTHRWPHILPGGRAVLFTIRSGRATTNEQIAVLNLDTSEERTLVPGGSYPRYSRTGHLIYGVNGTLRAVGFDLERLEVTDPNPVPVLAGVVTKASGAVDFDLARDGSLVYVAGSIAGGLGRTLVWVDRQGRAEPVAAEPRPYGPLHLSPDGQQIATSLLTSQAQPDIWIYDLTRDTPRRFTFDPAPDLLPRWTPDGKRIIFTSNRDGAWGLFSRMADGTGQVERLTTSAGSDIPAAMSFAPDGRLVFSETRAATRSNDIGVLSMDDEHRVEWLLATEFNESHPNLSPDGRWLAYTSTESGQRQVFVRPFPNVDDERWQVSRDGGASPVWGPDGRELFYHTNDGVLMAVENDTDPTFNPGTPVRLFDGLYLFGAYPYMFDVSPNGERFLTIRAPESADSTQSQLILVQNWFEELTRLVPAP